MKHQQGQNTHPVSESKNLTRLAGVDVDTDAGVALNIWGTLAREVACRQISRHSPDRQKGQVDAPTLAKTC